jgi:isochorismate hydrolase
LGGRSNIWSLIVARGLLRVQLSCSNGTLRARARPFRKLMPEKNIDLHGSAPDKHKSALLLIGVINDLDFPKADQLLKYARPMARNLLRLKRRAQKAGVPVIYVNDNFGRWKSDFRRTVEHCARHGRGRDVVKLLRPEESDYFVLKPKHSGFFSTTLETLLRYLETQTLILTGIAGNFFAFFSRPTMPTCATLTCLCPRIARSRTQRKKTILHSRS